MNSLYKNELSPSSIILTVCVPQLVGISEWVKGEIVCVGGVPGLFTKVLIGENVWSAITAPRQTFGVCTDRFSVYGFRAPPEAVA